MKKSAGILLCFTLFLLSACNKELSDKNEFTPYTGNPLNDTAWLKTVTINTSVYALADSLFPKNIFIDSIDLSKDQTLKYGDTLELEFKGGSCLNNMGTPQDGKAKIEILRLQKNGDFIKAYRPNTSFGMPLETGGAFFIRISKNGSELVLAPGSAIKIRYLDQEESSNDMQVFYGKESFPFPTGALDSAHTWVRDQDTSYIKTWNKQTNSGYKKGYELVAKKLRWISAHKYEDTAVAKTNIYAILPPNFTNKNTAVFTVFDHQRTVIGMRGDLLSRSFMAEKIPLRSRILLVSISKIGNDLFLGTRLVNDVGTMINYSFTPEKKSMQQILDFLNSL